MDDYRALGDQKRLDQDFVQFYFRIDLVFRMEAESDFRKQG